MPSPLSKKFAERSSEPPKQTREIDRHSDAPEKSKTVLKKAREAEIRPSKDKFPEIEPFFSLY